MKPVVFSTYFHAAFSEHASYQHRPNAPSFKYETAEPCDRHLLVAWLEDRNRLLKQPRRGSPLFACGSC